MSEIKDEIKEEVDEYVGGTLRKDRKIRYRKLMTELLTTYKNIMLCNIDHVGSKQMQQIRISLRGKGCMLMGKKTLMRKIIKDQINLGNEKLKNLLEPNNLLVKNTGLIFCNEDLVGVRKLIEGNKVPAPAKANSVAQCDVVIPAGPTGMDPGQTAFFQALNIPTKILKGAVEIVSDVNLLRRGDKVTQSHSVLLARLKITPFAYSVKILTVYEDGAVYDVKVLDTTADDLLARFSSTANLVAALSLRLKYPNQATIPHSIVRTFQSILGVAISTEYTFPQAEKYKQMIANPGAFLAAAPGPAAKVEVKKEEPKKSSSSSSVGGAMGMFGDDD
jgi:large subunit ribosomal protein LP0